jgi:multiple sugar transport system permease protein
VLPFVTIPDLYGTRTGIVLPTTAMLLPMGIILFTLYFRQIPDNLEAAARVEGATRIESLFYVVFPLSKPALAAVGFIVFIEVYNDYFWTSVLTGGTESVPTVATRLNGLMALPALTNANFIAAATLISLIPPLIVVLFLTGRFDYWMGLWTGE